MKRKLLTNVLSFILTLCMIATSVFSVLADEIEYGISVGEIKITSSKLEVDSTDSGSGVSAGNIVYEPDSKTLTLTDVVANPDSTAAIHVAPGTEVTIVLVGINTLTGAPGCAGIWVEAGWDVVGGDWFFNEEKSAKITIKGEGSLTANGGNVKKNEFGAGAGIGGNGVGHANTDGGDFGCIIIEDGTITANGGDTHTTHSDDGSAAGIGAGGINGGSWTYSGVINIKGGSITAQGGCGYTGAAAIGSGNAGSSYGTESNIVTNISGGTVIANGGTDAAGIGGSANGSGGDITISGGNVTANGGDEGNNTSYGGAGIGGGDNAGSGIITIKGNAVVTAVAGGASAGIGGGNGGYVPQIIIDDEASVTAYGGSAYSSWSQSYRGGAGIGSGNQGYFGVGEKTGKIYINTTGKVSAYSGRESMAIGVGTQPLSNYYFEVGKNAAEIWMYNPDTEQKPFIDDPAYITGFESTLTAFYTLPEGETYPAEKAISDVYTVPDGVALNWMHKGNTISVIRDGNVIKSGEFDESFTVGNWAVVIPQVDFSVKYEWSGELPNGVFEQTLPAGADSVLYGSTHVVDTTYTADTVIDNIIDGIIVGKWTFSGWDKSGTITIEDSVIIKGTWSYESYLAIEFEKTVDENGNPVEARDEKIYDIKLIAYNGKNINRLNSVDLTFVFDNVFGKNVYEIIDIADDNIAVNYVEEGRYEFHFTTKTNVTNDTAVSITLARVKFTGYGKFAFGVDDSVDTNVAHTTKLADNIVDTYVPGGVTADGKKAGALIIKDVIEDEIFTPVQKLTVKVSFPNNIVNNKTAYQAMKVTVSGSDINTITVNLGNDNPQKVFESDLKPDAKYTVTFDESENAYIVVFDGILTVNTTYNVAISGLGYRTTHYAVTMTKDKVLNFWNNVMDNAIEVEEGNAKSAVLKNFLAGDIVVDNHINIYDLSGVVSYFGTTIDKEALSDYAKYDLNRDGVIDSKDVAYVLVSWGE